MNVSEIKTLSLPVYREKLRLKKELNIEAMGKLGQLITDVFPWYRFNLIRYLLFTSDTLLNSILKRLTGLSQAERILLGLDVWKCLNVSQSNIDSRIAEISQQNLNSGTLKKIHIQLRKICPFPTSFAVHTEVLLAHLNLRPSFNGLEKKILRQLNFAQQAREEFVALQKIPYDKKNIQHYQILERVWDKMIGKMPRPTWDNKETDLCSPSSWTELGFQSGDPTLDFRGTGYLGCLNLEWFCLKHTLEAHEFLKQSQSFSLKEPWFPFAATSINVTMWLTIFLEMEYLDIFFHYAKRPSMEIFNILFSFTFIAFFHFWKFSNQKSIFEFGRISYKFLKLMDKCFSYTSFDDHATGQELIDEICDWTTGKFQSTVLNDPTCVEKPTYKYFIKQYLSIIPSYNNVS